jgi:hypothetical protein
MAAPVSTRRSNGRSERRSPKILAAELSRPDESVLEEMTFTENVSPRGVRVTTVRRWQPELACWLLFSGMAFGMAFGLKEGSFYCQHVESGKFALGLELPWQVQRWQMLW